MHPCNTVGTTVYCNITAIVRCTSASPSLKPAIPRPLTSASTTLYGSAYFLSISTRMKKEVVPQYSMSARRSSAAAECSTGMDTRRRTDEKMTASRREQVREAARGSSKPWGGEGGGWEEVGCQC